MTTAAVVLAAGAGTRFTASGGEGHKLLVLFRGRPLVHWAVQHAVEAGLDEVLVVTGAVDLGLAESSRVTLVANPNWAQGQATSLATAVDAAAARGHAAVVVGLGDQPLVSPEVWRGVAASSAAIAVATFAGQRRTPVRLAAEVWGLLERTGDEGARELMRRRPDLVEEVACDGNPVDVDTVEELDQWS